MGIEIHLDKRSKPLIPLAPMVNIDKDWVESLKYEKLHFKLDDRIIKEFNVPSFDDFAKQFAKDIVNKQDEAVWNQFIKQFGYDPYINNTKFIKESAKEILSNHKIEFINYKEEYANGKFVVSYDGVKFKEIKVITDKE